MEAETMEPVELQQKEVILDFLSECVLEGTISNDSAACFDALAEIAPGYFATLATSRHVGENWALKKADFKKLLRFMEIFFQMEVKKKTHLLSKVDATAIAKHGDSHHALIALKLVAVAAVLCRRKSTFIQRMMERLSANAQGTLKLVLEETMESLVDVDETTTQEETTELTESSTTENTQTLKGTVERSSKVTSAADIQSPYNKYLQDSQERETRIRRLEAQLLERDDTISALTLENDTLRGALQDQTSKVDQLTAENQRLADEIDILHPQVQQLYQSQTEISALKQRVEDLSFEKGTQSHDGAKEMSESLPISDEDMDIFPCFEDSDASSNPFFALYETMTADNDLAIIPDDVDELATVDQLKCQLELLIESQQLKESENENLLREKEKLAAYAKRAVTRYQDQYLAAKQDLASSQTKLSEQQELIGMLQRRIEQQLSSSSSTNRRRKNKVDAVTMKRTVQEYGLGAY